mmetsp:Transcript_102107/g.315097  ORF Transcript_102107/g.315097 Transcript_102107/m.315097 type:complete len:253 (+) Transcript_102107:1989-2747(+)
MHGVWAPGDLRQHHQVPLELLDERVVIARAHAQDRAEELVSRTGLLAELEEVIHRLSKGRRAQDAVQKLQSKLACSGVRLLDAGEHLGVQLRHVDPVLELRLIQNLLEHLQRQKPKVAVGRVEQRLVLLEGEGSNRRPLGHHPQHAADRLHLHALSLRRVEEVRQGLHQLRGQPRLPGAEQLEQLHQLDGAPIVGGVHEDVIELRHQRQVVLGVLPCKLQERVDTGGQDTLVFVSEPLFELRKERLQCRRGL